MKASPRASVQNLGTRRFDVVCSQNQPTPAHDNVMVRGMRMRDESICRSRGRQPLQACLAEGRVDIVLVLAEEGGVHGATRPRLRAAAWLVAAPRVGTQEPGPQQHQHSSNPVRMIYINFPSTPETIILSVHLSYNTSAADAPPAPRPVWRSVLQICCFLSKSCPASPKFTQ